MSQFCFDTKADAEKAIADPKRVRVYEAKSPKFTKFVIAPSKELAYFRFGSEFGDVTIAASRSESATPAAKVPSQKQINQLVDQAASATDLGEAQKILQQVKSLREQLEAHKAAKKAAVNAPAPPAPPAPPADNVPAPPAV